MKFFIYNTVASKRGKICDQKLFNAKHGSNFVQSQAVEIARCDNHDQRNEMKKLLPVITWQATFKNGRRKNDEAIPSGLYMVDFDDVKDVEGLMEAAYKKKELLGIVYVGKSISGRGVRIVAECRPEFKTIAECQQWMSGQLGQEYDAACKDWSRCSYVVPRSYIRYFDEGVFEREAKVVYQVNDDDRGVPLAKGGADVNDDDKVKDGENDGGNDGVKAGAREASEGIEGEIQREYNGVKLMEIAREWLVQNGGEPKEGERHTKLTRLAVVMRYITDFTPEVICANIPHYGLSEREVMSFCASACGAKRGMGIPESLRRVLNTLRYRQEMGADAGEEKAASIESYEEPMPELPPLFSHFAKIAPKDFKSAVVLCLLPMLGTLGSKLRGYYTSGKVESPTFHVTLEASQASGKSFIERVNDIVMKPMKEKDEESRLLEDQYREEDEAMRRGSTKKEREEYKKSKEERRMPIVREMGATASLTKVLKRMQAAKGLHLYAMAVELDTVAKAFKRSFSNLSDFLRCAFDNSEFAQDYASETSWSGRVKVYYNLLYSGTPGAVAKFYNDEEDGTMSRTLFVTFPDQFGKKLPVWGTFSAAEKEEVEMLTKGLYGVSIQGDEVQEAYWMKMDFLNTALQKWCEEQRARSIADPRHQDRTRGFFHRRCAEVGFRAGMLAHYLWGEQSGEVHEKRVNDFAIWVAEKMLQQFIVRIDETNCIKDNMNSANLFNVLPNEFSREELEQELVKVGRKERTTSLLSRWALSGKIQPFAKGASVFKKRV